jgi:hypothetical protein
MTENEKLFEEFLEEYLENVKKKLPDSYRAKQLKAGGLIADLVYKFETDFLKEPFMKAIEKEDKNDIRKMPIHNLICDECGKPINKGTRVGGSFVLISKSMAGTKLLCPEHIMDDEKKRLCGLFKEKVIEIAQKKKSKPLDLLKAIKEIETRRW